MEMPAILTPLVISAYLAVASIVDLKTHKVPNWLTLPPMIALGAIRLTRFDLVFLAYWAGIYLCWAAHVWGGGDAKLLMALFALWPTLDFLWIECLTTLVLGIPLLIAEYRRSSPGELALRAYSRLATGDILPGEEKLAAGSPATWLLAMGGLVYSWLAWAQVEVPSLFAYLMGNSW